MSQLRPGSMWEQATGDLVRDWAATRTQYLRTHSVSLPMLTDLELMPGDPCLRVTMARPTPLPPDPQVSRLPRWWHHVLASLTLPLGLIGFLWWLAWQGIVIAYREMLAIWMRPPAD